MGRLEGKVALVTGAARGMGRSHAIRLAQEGADVIAFDLCQDMATVPYPLATEEDLAETVSLVRATGRRIISERVDVRDLPDFKKALNAAVEDVGRLDIVVANAGILSIASTLDLTYQMWQDMIDVNLTGAWVTAKASIPYLISGGVGGSIVFISSISGLRGIPNVGHYVAAKHGVVGLMRSLSNELAEHRIRVNAVNPTNVNTAMIQNEFLRRLWVPDVQEPTVEQFQEVGTQMNALPVPWVEPEDVSNAVVFLVSDEARYITGVALPVDAGYVSKA